MEGVGYDAVLAALYAVYVHCLLVYGQVFVDNAHAAFARHGNCQLVLGDRVHRRGHKRYIERKIFCKLHARVSKPGKHSAACGNK